MERQFVGFKSHQKGVEWLDEFAEEISVVLQRRITRSDVIRSALVVARAHESEIHALLREQP